VRSFEWARPVAKIAAFRGVSGGNQTRSQVVCGLTLPLGIGAPLPFLPIVPMFVVRVS
jgi:hypothetical protein